ncbi:Cyclin-dependent kinase 20 [Coelomomyces lativittatus]|nr:Cyclin-dependent kinase 20 [Coelomomyces lativittatus]KAJ1516142.1 Cyclin-dependent kinase 20 [Coelomomyces lativittatus]
MLNHFPLFPGQNDIDQLHLVLSTLGTPTLEEWPEMLELPDYPKIFFPDFPPQSFSEILPDISDCSRDLISKMLVYNGKKRITAKNALLSSYFKFWKEFEECLVRQYEFPPWG